MPLVSRFGGGGRAKKKQGVIEKLKAFFEKYFGLGIAEYRVEETESEFWKKGENQDEYEVAAEAGKGTAAVHAVIEYGDFCNRVSAWHPVFLHLGLAIKNFFKFFEK